MNKIMPIEEPQRVYVGQELYVISEGKVTKKVSSSVQSVIGNEIHYAAVNSLKVKSVEASDGEVSLIINKDKENIRIATSPEKLMSDGDGAIFDTEEKAQAVAKSINSVNIDKISSMETELQKAKGFLKELLEKGA